MFTPTAHILSACNTVARRNNSNCNTQRTSSPLDVYYKVNLRMYVHFNSLRSVKPVEEVYLGSIFAPYKQINIDTFNIPAKTYCTEHTLTVDSSKCSKGIDTYVREHLEDFKGCDMWKVYKEKIIHEYQEEVLRKYNIIVDTSYLDYNIQYCWDVEV